MRATRRVWAKRLLLAATFTIGVITATKVAIGLWQRFSAVERVDVRGKKEWSLIEREHVARYEFAKPYCAGKTVADIASGTGYGTEMLRAVAKSVDGYDREPLGQEFVIDLDKQSWSKRYDVIVSFETIEHLDKPEFFLQNVRKTARTLILSTPLNERRGWSSNPHHKQFWTQESLRELLEKHFTCEYYRQQGSQIQKVAAGTPPERRPHIAVAVCEAHP